MLNESGFTPNGDLVLILPPPVEEKTAGGIVLPQSSQSKEGQATRVGKIVAMGALAHKDPRMDGIALGDMVLFLRYCGDFLPIDGVTYIVMRAEQVLGKITKLPEYQIGSAKSTFEVFGAAA